LGFEDFNAIWTGVGRLDWKKIADGILIYGILVIFTKIMEKL
jgi:hypothetical protein